MITSSWLSSVALLTLSFFSFASSPISSLTGLLDLFDCRKSPSLYVPKNQKPVLMATSQPLITSLSPFSSTRCSNHRPTSTSLPSSSCSRWISVSSTACLKELRKRSRERFHHLTRTSSEGVPSDLVEDPKFVPLNADDPVYGPPALLLMGFEADETDKILKFLKELDGEFLKIIHCTEDMITQSIWDAMHTEQPNLQDVKIAKSLPRICFMSGLSGEEMMMFIDAFPETGLKPAVFAALVPNSADKLLIEVAEEIMGDHEMMSAKKPR